MEEVILQSVAVLSTHVRAARHAEAVAKRLGLGATFIVTQLLGQ